MSILIAGGVGFLAGAVIAWVMRARIAAVEAKAIGDIQGAAKKL